MRRQLLFLGILIFTTSCRTIVPGRSDPDTADSGGARASVTTVDLANDDATAETRSLFAYLKNVSTDGVLFGHQHHTTQGLTISKSDGTESDTLATIGDFAAVYGWDTLSILQPQAEESITGPVKQAFARGGIITISTHFNNPITFDKLGSGEYRMAGTAWDKTPAVAASLPGGKAHVQYTAFLDEFADWALALKDEKGTAIPIIFRILHEHTGNWFWWGAKHCTPDEYIALFRYTVDHLTKERGVRNLLFAYSPSTYPETSESAYLERYPGDDYVDILGFDAYGPAQNNANWFSEEVFAYAAMVSKMARARGKISAICEIGISAPDAREGKYDAHWYRKLLAGLKSHPDASEVAWLLVWRNGSPHHYWVPTDIPADRDRGTLEDFKAFAADRFTRFNRDLHGVYSCHTVEADGKQ